MQLNTLTISEVARIRSGLVYGTGTIYQYSVNGLPHGHEAMLANVEARQASANWKILYIKDGRSGEWTGNYPKAEDALAVLELITQCNRVADNPRSSSLEADQARELIADWFELPNRFRAIADSPGLSTKRTIGEAQAAALKTRMIDFLSATRGRW
jgi:hypothetical protein